ncbi:MAG: tandem-95 repeat protein [Paracoccaceae bacterium]|nr:tandem-95 repeat protein [Paracoccaceae bacterium]
MARGGRSWGDRKGINGNNGDDTLDGRGGSYILRGGKGNDTYIVDGDDTITEKANGGRDHVISFVDFLLGDNLEDLTLAGTADIDGTGTDTDNNIIGNSGDNTLDGRGGDDTLDGRDGDDSLFGGDGDDLLTGGAGSDLIDGGAGDNDVAVFAGLAGDYTVERNGGDLLLTSIAGETDVIRNVEYLAFDDRVVAVADIVEDPGGVPLPEAIDDSSSVSEDGSVVISVLDNDLGQGLRLSAVNDATMGNVTVNDDGTVTYRPLVNATGSDQFTYTITDFEGRTSTATVWIDVTASNDAPVAQDDSYNAAAGETYASAGSVLENDSDVDGDGLWVSSYDATSSGGGTVDVNADGTFTYDPADGFSGIDTFSYTVNDGNGGTATATVSVSVEGNDTPDEVPNNAPVAIDDSFASEGGEAVSGNVLDNDSDPDGDALSVTDFDATSSGGGTVTMSAGGGFTYTPASGFSGNDDFTYAVSDGNGGTSSATVNVTVDAPPASLPPVTPFEGYGANTTGGRGGQIIKVTTSADSGVGSLRWALEDVSGPRIIVFEVNEVNLTSSLVIRDGDVTVAGQTAGGVQVSGAPLRIVDSNVIIQGMIFRPGDDVDGSYEGNRDALSIGTSGKTVSNLIIDHNSFEWGIDENVTFYRNVTDVTLSNNIIAQGLYDSVASSPAGTGLLLHAGGSTEMPERITITNNLLAFNSARNPWVKHGQEIELINNYIYAPKDQHRAIDLGDRNNTYSDAQYMSVHVIGNVYQAGQETRTTDFSNDWQTAIRVMNYADSDFYIDGNLLLDKNGQPISTEYYGSSSSDVSSSLAFAGSGVTILDSDAVIDYVLANAGAAPGDRDEVDQRIIDLIRAGEGGLVDSVAEAGGWPDLPSFAAPSDQDGDGMPDWFEDQFGFDKTSFDAHGDSDGDGYSNIEEYLNGLIYGFDLSGSSGTSSGSSVSGGSSETTSAGTSTTNSEPVTPTASDPVPEVVEPGSLRLMDADSDSYVADLSDGVTLDAALLGNDALSIEYVADSINFASVKFDFQNGQVTQVESIEPYALFGDWNGDLAPSTIGALFPEAGVYEVDLTFYSEKYGQGTVLGTDSISFTVAEGGGAPAQPEPLPPVEEPAEGFVKNINVGGGAFVAADGTAFEADPGIASGWMVERQYYGTHVSGTDDDLLYNDYGFGHFSYQIEMPDDGLYEVTLYLTEPWARDSGERVFDVALEGAATGSFNDIDIHAQTDDRWAALTLTETVQVTDGVLDIDVTASVDNGILSGISINELV